MLLFENKISKDNFLLDSFYLSPHFLISFPLGT